MVLEGIITTTNRDGSVHIATMGASVGMDWARLLIRPFQTTTTYANLRRHGAGVLHVTDDVELMVRAAIGVFDSPPDLVPSHAVAGYRLADTCRWYAFRIESIDVTAPRAEIPAQVIDSGRIRDFFGFNRARHAVIEAAILATRLTRVDNRAIEAAMAQASRLIAKTGGGTEQAAYGLLEQYLLEHLPANKPSVPH